MIIIFLNWCSMDGVQSCFGDKVFLKDLNFILFDSFFKIQWFKSISIFDLLDA